MLIYSTLKELELLAATISVWETNTKDFPCGLLFSRSKFFLQVIMKNHDNEAIKKKINEMLLSSLFE